MNSKVEQVVVSTIRPPTWNNQVDEPTVCGLMASMGNGQQLINPIHVTVRQELIAGRQRLEAATRLGWEKIKAFVWDVEPIEAEIMSLTENLDRKHLTAQQRIEFDTRRKALLAKLHPSKLPSIQESIERLRASADNAESPTSTPRQVGAAVSPEGGKPPKRPKKGDSKRSEQRRVTIGSNLAEGVLEAIAGTPIEDNQSQIEALSKCPPEKQKPILALLAAGKAKTVKEAALLDANTCPNCGATEKDEDGDCAKCHEPAAKKPKAGKRTPTEAEAAKAQVKIWADTIGRWLGKSPSIDELREKFPGKQGDAVVAAATKLYEALKHWQKAIK